MTVRSFADGHERVRVARPTPPPLIQSSGTFVEGFTPPDYLVDGLLQRRFCYSLTGQTGGGKTAVSLLIAANVARGLSVAGRETERGTVLFFAGENPDDIRMRWLAMAEAYQFDVDEIEVHFVPGRFSFKDLRARVSQEVETLGGVVLLIVDTSAAYFLGDNENDNVQAGAHARAIRDFTKLAGGPTVIVNCHPVKNAGGENLQPRGGGAFIAEVDGNLTCSKSETTVTLHWQGKFRRPDFEPTSFELVPSTAERLKDTKGRSIYTVYARALSDEEERNKANQSRTDEDDVLLVLASAEGPLSVAEIARQTGWISAKGKPMKSKAHRALQALREHKLVASERDGATLTDKGKAEAKKADYNRRSVGASYG